MLPSIGLFHSSEQNAFNLADDLIEPYRPIVDLYVAEQIPPMDSDDLRPADKLGLIALLNVDVVMPRGTMSVLASVEQAAESLARLFDGGSEQALELPRLLRLNRHRFEM
jgi:CRISPR-associated protein Cas1